MQAGYVRDIESENSKLKQKIRDLQSEADNVLNLATNYRFTPTDAGWLEFKAALQKLFTRLNS